MKKNHPTCKNGWLKLILQNKPIRLKNEWPEKTHYFKKWTNASGVLKKTYCLYKILMLQKDPVNSSCSKKLQYPERKLSL